MKFLILNSGSSSVKFKLYDMNKHELLVSGLIEEIGSSHSSANLKVESTGEKYLINQPIKNHEEAILLMSNMLKQSGVIASFDELDAIGHRIVHGGEYFKHSKILTKEDVDMIESISPLAPLHNPGHAAGIRSMMKLSPKTPNIGVFDTVFHQSMPKHAYMYALPYEFYTKYHVRKYGFHGTSHSYISKIGSELVGKKIDNFTCITLHIGNGVSMCAIKNGKCIDTSMGLTPLEGLIMGTRSGDLDAAIIEYLANQTGKTLHELDIILNKKSGLLGVCGHSDMRHVQDGIANGDELCKLAYDMYIYRIIKYVGAYSAILGDIDALIFTAGVGENLAKLRVDVCDKLTHFGIHIDAIKNDESLRTARVVSKDNSKTTVMVIPTNEELAIAMEILELIKG
ncbi:MAG: acetate kinase [Campylobacter sp.]|nr:acetate kinase [Campylobacter sp.]